MIDPNEIPSSTTEQATMMEGILIACAPGGSPDNHIYEHLRRELMADVVIRDLLPQFVRTYRNLDAFWPFIKHEAATLRNRLSDSHGRGGKLPVKPSARHASLAVNTVGAIAAFLVETYLERQERA